MMANCSIKPTETNAARRCSQVKFNYCYFFASNIIGLLLLDINRVHVELLVAELVKPCEGEPEVGRLEQVLDLLAVGVEPGGVDVDAGRQDSIDHL